MFTGIDIKKKDFSKSNQHLSSPSSPTFLQKSLQKKERHIFCKQADEQAEKIL